MKSTPLYQQHQQANAHLVDFYGWALPLSYGSQIEEHHAVRHHVGMFDVSHMALVDVVGDNVQDFLRYLLANDVAKMKHPGRAQYTLMLNESGGFLDDLIVFFCDERRYRLIFNAVNAQRNIDWVNEQAQAYDITVSQLSHHANIAIQGPETVNLLSKIWPGYIDHICNLRPFRFVEDDQWLISRTGYTGEDGFEIMLPADQAPGFWQELLKEGAQPCGLGARDTLRLEAGLNLYGQDMDESTLPAEANLNWVLAWRDGDRQFIGRNALESKQPETQKQLVGVVLLERGVLRSEQVVVKDEQTVGHVTSGTFSPTIQRGIGLIRVDRSIEIGETVNIRYRRRTLRGLVVKPPFVRQGEILIANFKE